MKLKELLADRRAQIVGGAIVVAIALPVSWWSLRDETAVAQNPIGDEATATAADTDGPPVVEDPAPAEVAAVKHTFGSSASEAQQCLDARVASLRAAAEAQRADSSGKRPGTARDAEYALRYGWYPEMPAFRDGSILPCARIVAYYGHPNSTRMGALGEFPKDEMLRRLRAQVAEWEAADPTTPVVPALHMVSVVAQGEPGTSGHYRTITGDQHVQKVYDWAKEVNGIFFVDIQVGTDDLRNILPRFEWILKNPDVHLAVDPEFMMKDGSVPGRKIGTMDAADINYAIDYLADLVNEHGLPPKVLVIHRFTRNMVSNSDKVRLRPEVQYVSHMDGWGAPWLKYDSFAHYIVQEPVQFTGFKVFYHNDTKKGDPLVTPADMTKVHPVPLYVQYQ